MYKSDRDTGQWFKADFKPMIQDRTISTEMGPGKYETNYRREVNKRNTSWNYGKIPFKTGVDRFSTDYRVYLRPGPGQYN